MRRDKQTRKRGFFRRRLRVPAVADGGGGGGGGGSGGDRFPASFPTAPLASPPPAEMPANKQT